MMRVILSINTLAIQHISFRVTSVKVPDHLVGMMCTAAELLKSCTVMIEIRDMQSKLTDLA